MNSNRSIETANTRRALALLLLVSVALHAIYLTQFQQTPYSLLLMVDAEGYHAKALKILENGWLGDEAFFQSPPYPYFLAVLYKVFGISFLPVQIVHALLSISSVYLIYCVGKELFDDVKTGLASAALAVFYGVFVYYSGLLLKVTLSLFFTCALLLALLRACRTPTWRNYCFAGICLGSNAILLGNFILMIPAYAAWTIYSVPPHPAKRRNICLLLLGTALIIAPVTIRNYYLEKDFVLISYGGGPSFYIGNSNTATGFQTHVDRVRPNPEFEEKDYRERAEKMSGRKLKPSEVSRFWFQKSFDFILGNPIAFLKLTAWKFSFFLNNYEIPDNYDLAFMKIQTPILKAGFIPFGLLLVGATLGIFLFRWKTPAFQLLYIHISIYMLSVVMFYVTSRFRVPVVPALIPLTAHFMLAGWKKIGELRGVGRVGFAAAFVLVAFVAFRPFSISDFAFEYWKIGMGYDRKGMLNEALGSYKKSLEINPGYAMSHLHLGNVLKQMGKPDEALAEFQKAVKLQPSFSEAHLAIAAIYLEKRLDDEALATYQTALQIKPDIAEAQFNMGNIYQRKGALNEAIREYLTVIKLKPDFAAAHFNLGGIYFVKSDLPRSAHHYDRAGKLGMKLPREILEILESYEKQTAIIR